MKTETCVAANTTSAKILREVHPDVGEMKAQVVEEQGERIEAVAERVTEAAEAVASPEASAGGHRRTQP
jgi:hypothetical protein